MKRVSDRVEIFGAGLAGLVASIKLAQRGLEVHLYERQRRIGGHPDWHPSIHTTVLNADETWDYLGMDLGGCFQHVDTISFYRYGQKKLLALDHMYACERGPREGALDTYLYHQALGLGVEMHFLKGFERERITQTEKVIIATGLETDVYRQLGLPFVPVFGYRGVQETGPACTLTCYMARCTERDFGYVATDHELLFALLFSRGQLGPSRLQEFEQLLATTEGIHIDKWSYSTGAIPTRAQLFHQGLVLAGTLSGMIDPFLLHGVSGALTSGCIAAQAITDPQGARGEFHRLARNFAIKRALKELALRLPLKRVSVPAMMLVDSRLQGVGFVRQR